MISNLTTVTFYICQFQPKLTGVTNFCQTAETYLYYFYFSSTFLSHQAGEEYKGINYRVSYRICKFHHYVYLKRYFYFQVSEVFHSNYLYFRKSIVFSKIYQFLSFFLFQMKKDFVVINEYNYVKIVRIFLLA